MNYAEVVDRIDSGSIVDMIFFYFSKAFDVVNHSIILNKLQVLDVESKLLLWVRNFLVGRTLRVTVAGETSDTKTVTSGAPKDLSWVQCSF